MTVSSEKIFQTIFQHLTIPLVVVKANTPHFTIVACNEEYKKVSNTFNTNIIGKGIKDLYIGNEVNEQGDELIKMNLEKAAKNGEVIKLDAVRYDMPVTGTNKTEQRWWQAEYTPIAGADGTTEYLLCATHDITEQITGRDAIKRAQQQEEALQREMTLTEELKAANEELYQSQLNLEKLNNELEERVLNRTHALALSEENFRSMILQSPIAMGFFSGEEMTLQVINDTFLQLWGRSKEIIGKPLLEALPELIDQPYHTIMRQVLATGETYYGNEAKVMLFRNGRMDEGYYNFINHPFKNAEGNNIGVIVVAMEVTEQVMGRQKQQQLNNTLAAINEKLSASNEELLAANDQLAEAHLELENLISKLEESEARLTRFFMQAPAGICILDGKDLIFELINAPYQQLFPDRELLGKPLLEAVPEVKGQPIWDILQGVYHTGKTFEGNGLLIPLARYNNGPVEDRYFNFIYQARLDAKGNTDGILVFVFEVTEQVIATKKVEQAEELLRFAIEAADVGTWYVDVLTRELKASDRMKTLFGYGEDEVMTLDNALQQIPEDERQKVITAIDDAIENKNVYNIDHKVIAKGEVKWVKALGKLTKNEEGKYHYFSGVSLDITEQKKDEIRKNDFIAMVSHELKTPLTALKAYVQLVMIKADKNEDTFTRNAIDKVHRQVNKMTAMINGFLDVARLEAGKIQLNKTNFELDTLIKETIAEISFMMQHESITFLPCEPVLVHADAEKIGQVILNLLNNAIKYSNGSKRIEVTCLQTEDNAQVSVKDEGIGIKPEHIDKLFNRFYRVEDSRNQTISGFGIGLYLSAEIIRWHNGKIWVESEVNKGSTFSFSLPIVK